MTQGSKIVRKDVQLYQSISDINSKCQKYILFFKIHASCQFITSQLQIHLSMYAVKMGVIAFKISPL